MQEQFTIHLYFKRGSEEIRWYNIEGKDGNGGMDNGSNGIQQHARGNK